jgi:hypothetical protein
MTPRPHVMLGDLSGSPGSGEHAKLLRFAGLIAEQIIARATYVLDHHVLNPTSGQTT